MNKSQSFHIASCKACINYTNEETLLKNFSSEAQGFVRDESTFLSASLNCVFRIKINSDFSFSCTASLLINHFKIGISFEKVINIVVFVAIINNIINFFVVINIIIKICIAHSYQFKVASEALINFIVVIIIKLLDNVRYSHEKLRVISFLINPSVCFYYIVVIVINFVVITVQQQRDRPLGGAGPPQHRQVLRLLVRVLKSSILSPFYNNNNNYYYF